MKKILIALCLLAFPALAVRDPAGVYSLPNPPFVTGTPISSTVMNNNFADIATALSDSLSRSGKGGMLTSFLFTDGSAASPAMSFTNEQTTGFYRKSAGKVCLSLVNVETLCVDTGTITYNTYKIPNYFDLMMFFPGKMVNSQVLARLAMTGTTILKATLPSAVGFAGTATTASTTVTLNKRTAGGVTTAIGTMVWNAAQTNVTTITFASDATFSAGDFLELVGPATADATMADVSITLQARRQ